MSRDGLGTYNLPAGNPVVTGTTISSTTQNTTMSDIASALTQSVSKDGQTTMTGTLNMGTNAISGVTSLTITGGVVGPVLSVGAPSSGVAASITAVAAGVVQSWTDGTVTATATFNGTAFSIGPTSAHTLNLATNGSNRVAVTSAGNVTINAPGSGNTLSLTSVAGGFGILVNDVSGQGQTFRNATNTTGFDLGLLGGTGDATAYVTNRFAANLMLGTSNSTRVQIGSAGNVTVNAPSSGSPLAINGIAATNVAMIARAGTTTGAMFDSWSNTGGLLWAGLESSAGGVLFTGSSAYAAVLGTENSTSLQLGTNAAIRLSIASTGAVTINNPASSGAALVVNGSASTPAFSIGNSGTAFTLDCSKSNVHYVTMNGNVAAGSLTISNIQDGQTVNLYLTQDGTGSRTLGNPTGVKWPGGVPSPILSTPASSLDCITFQRQNGITTATVLRAFA
jgi:hypothetical protein